MVWMQVTVGQFVNNVDVFCAFLCGYVKGGRIGLSVPKVCGYPLWMAPKKIVVKVFTLEKCNIFCILR